MRFVMLVALKLSRKKGRGITFADRSEQSKQDVGRAPMIGTNLDQIANLVYAKNIDATAS
jgi:hypothetical protein